ncbi:hypothetical protein [Cytobacillus sp. IB215316]|uniref:hypothetical protein n=1 Tax=Cytobacillus sp. IB215316 TaxID=3097354 RepID=UPI002A0F0E05|nr:hypothetical protein [Cytobacillus sp. IB215316]MDX8360660.1 hypothetical protein [Cytobacillus sp. IB215316]
MGKRYKSYRIFRFDSKDGVWYYNNDDIFKVAAEAIGEGTQSTSDDPGWRLGPSYETYKDYIKTYGPSYLSMNHEPYGGHTVTVKGYAKYKTTFKDQFLINRTYYDEFVRINDHWGTTSGDAYLYLNRAGSSFWYLQGIEPN